MLKRSISRLPESGEAAGEDWLFACLAWRMVEPRKAAALFDACLSETPVIWPIACQVAQMIWKTGFPGAEEWKNNLLGRLVIQLQEAIQLYDPECGGMPTWVSAERSLFPLLFRENTPSLDLAVLLLNELKAFEEMAGGNQAVDDPAVQQQLDKEQGALLGWFWECVWNEDFLLFTRDSTGSREQVEPDLSPIGFFPLIWCNLPHHIGEGGLERASGVLEHSAWTARSWVLFYALLDVTPYRGLQRRMRSIGLAAASPLLRAVWRVLSVAGGLPKWCYVLICTILLVGIPSVLAWTGVVFLPEVVMPPEEQAQQFCQEGRHADAARIYAALAAKEDRPYFLFRQAGEYMHLKDPASAALLYETLAKEAGTHPSVRMNLALAKHWQGRTQEAIALYDAVALDDKNDHPDSAARAERAAALLRLPLSLAP